MAHTLVTLAKSQVLYYIEACCVLYTESRKAHAQQLPFRVMNL